MNNGKGRREANKETPCQIKDYSNENAMQNRFQSSSRKKGSTCFTPKQVAKKVAFLMLSVFETIGQGSCNRCDLSKTH